MPTVDCTPKPYQEWVRRPSYHGSYDDYVRHMNSMAALFQRERDRRNNEEIAELVAKKLKEKA